MPEAAARDEIVAFLDTLLDSPGFPDYGPNGLQVPGRDAVRHVATGVSANRALIEAAAEAGADMLLVHHGLFWSRQAQAIDRVMAGRLRPLFVRDISLVAYHLPLDAHLGVGNNALLAGSLGLSQLEPFSEHMGRTIGVQGHFAGDGISADELEARLTKLCQAPVAFKHGPERVRTVGIVAGSAADDVHVAAALGLDAFITGEPAERSQGAADEEGVHFFAAGHHATERSGVIRLGELLAERFGVQHTFIDVPNPV